MKAIRLLILLIPLLLLAACHSGRHREMLTLLDEADSLNRVYAQLPSDSLLRHAADTLSKAGHFHTCRKQLMRSEKLFVSFLWRSDNKLYFCIHKARQELRAALTNLPIPPA